MHFYSQNEHLPAHVPYNLTWYLIALYCAACFDVIVFFFGKGVVAL